MVNEAKQRTQEVDLDKVDKFIEEKLTEEAKLKESYELIQKTAEKFLAVKGSFYRKDNYQAYIAAFLLNAKGKKTVLQLSAGQGKTFIIMMITKHWVEKSKTVSIVVPSPLLKKQMK